MDTKNSLILILVVSGLLSLFLSFFAMRKEKVKGSVFFYLMMICICGYSLGYALELHSTTLPVVMMALKIQYLTITYIPALWFFLASTYCGFFNFTGFKHFMPFLIIPFISQFLVMTAEHHNLYYINPTIEAVGPFMLFHSEKAVWYYIQVIYTNLMILSGNVMFGRMIFKTSGKHKKQAIMAFTASMIPWIGNILYSTGTSPYGLDVTPLFLAATGPLFSLAIFRYQMFDLTPLARGKIFEIISDPVIVFDDEYRLVDMNKSAGEFFGFYGDKAIGESAEQLLAEYTVLKDQLTGEPKESSDINPGSFDIKNEKDGDTKYYRSRVEPMFGASSRIIGKIMILNDNTAEQLLIAKLNRTATTDELTGINNRRSLMDSCSREIAKGKRYGFPLSLLMIDLDFFKKINDRYGHPCGDETLKRVSEVFQKNLREGDILGRYGGEEFIIMLHHSMLSDARSTAERFRKSVEEEKIVWNGEAFSVTVSIGISAYSGEGEVSLETLIHRADTALYRAKEAGRNRVEFFN